MVADAQIRSKLETSYDIVLAVRAPEHPEDTTFLEVQRPTRWMTNDDWPDRRRGHLPLVRHTVREARGRVREPNPRATSARSSAQPSLTSAVFWHESAAQARDLAPWQPGRCHTNLQLAACMLRWVVAAKLSTSRLLPTLRHFSFSDNDHLLDSYEKKSSDQRAVEGGRP